MDEGLGNVASELALADVELFSEKPRRAARRPIAFEPGASKVVTALSEIGKGEHEPAE